MDTRTFKTNLINQLISRNIYTEKVSEIQYRTRCPFCGDSRSNIHTGHFYIRIDPSDNAPILYHCFRCPAEGILDKEVLDLLEINSDDLSVFINDYNKNTDKLSSQYKYENVMEKHFDYKLPTSYNLNKIQYIEGRIGHNFSTDELKDIKIITSLKDFLILNDIHLVTCKKGLANLLENKYVGFLSSNGSYILFRDATGTEEMRWYKYPISQESIGQKVFYTTSSTIDLYTSEKIIINISEGVLDCLSIKYNLQNNNSDNILNIAICGKFYLKMVKNLIGMGFIGENIIINVYADNDGTDDTSLEYFKKNMKKYSYMVGQINILYNTISKDCGVPIDQIKLQSHRI